MKKRSQEQFVHNREEDLPTLENLSPEEVHTLHHDLAARFEHLDIRDEDSSINERAELHYQLMYLEDSGFLFERPNGDDHEQISFDELSIGDVLFVEAWDRLGNLATYEITINGIRKDGLRVSVKNNYYGGSELRWERFDARLFGMKGDEWEARELTVTESESEDERSYLHLFTVKGEKSLSGDRSEEFSCSSMRTQPIRKVRKVIQEQESN